MKAGEPSLQYFNHKDVYQVNSKTCSGQLPEEGMGIS